MESPRLEVVEPKQVDCLYQSAMAAHLRKATGSVDSIVAELACGEASPLAWKIQERCVDYFMTIDDTAAVSAMRMAATGNASDPPLVVGESGAAGLVGLISLLQHIEWKTESELGPQSRVLLTSTEGATATAVYETCVGATAESVPARQAAWLRISDDTR
jgi:diaminopropionate ammonia-lyase